ncbi:MAG: helix-turn-helix transcriptional regulator [Deltaproteobacteria bacterium]|nr:helix-turn-helix transcriptional regulator [Deltaproteobacteria bacterium]
MQLIEERVLSNIRELVMPFLEKLKSSAIDTKQKSYANIVESNLEDIISPFSHRLSVKHLKLTPAEIQISNLIKQGKTTKEIANLLNLSDRTIETHRKNIRRKIGIRNKSENLRTHLMNIYNG